MYVHRRQAALILFLVALVAVAAFALGITLCIDWTGVQSVEYRPPPMEV